MEMGPENSTPLPIGTTFSFVNRRLWEALEEEVASPPDMVYFSCWVLQLTVFPHPAPRVHATSPASQTEAQLAYPVGGSCGVWWLMGLSATCFPQHSLRGFAVECCRWDTSPCPNGIPGISLGGFVATSEDPLGDGFFCLLWGRFSASSAGMALQVVHHPVSDSTALSTGSGSQSCRPLLEMLDLKCRGVAVPHIHYQYCLDSSPVHTSQFLIITIPCYS